MFVELQSYKNKESIALRKEKHVITKNRTLLLKQKTNKQTNKK